MDNVAGPAPVPEPAQPDIQPSTPAATNSHLPAVPHHATRTPSVSSTQPPPRQQPAEPGTNDAGRIVGQPQNNQTKRSASTAERDTTPDSPRTVAAHPAPAVRTAASPMDNHTTTAQPSPSAQPAPVPAAKTTAPTSEAENTTSILVSQTSTAPISASQTSTAPQPSEADGDTTTFERVRTLRRQQRQELSGGVGDIVALQMGEIKKLRRDEGRARRVAEQKYEAEVARICAAQAKEADALAKKQQAETEQLRQQAALAFEAHAREERARMKKCHKDARAREKAEAAALAAALKRERATRVAEAKVAPTAVMAGGEEVRVSPSSARKAAVKRAKEEHQGTADVARQELDHVLESAQAMAEIDLRAELAAEIHALEEQFLEDVCGGWVGGVDMCLVELC